MLNIISMNDSFFLNELEYKDLNFNSRPEWSYITLIQFLEENLIWPINSDDLRESYFLVLLYSLWISLF